MRTADQGKRTQKAARAAQQISCIIPTRNRSEMTLQAVSSVLAQEGDLEIEIIVVDDASSDDTASKLAERFPEVNVIGSKERLGPAGARNLGARQAGGSVIMFLDSDDLWHADHCLLLAEALERTPCAFCITQNIDMNTGDLFQVPDQETISRLRRADLLDELFRWCYIMPSSFAVSKEAFFEIGGFPEAGLGEDWLFFIEAACRYEIQMVERAATTRRLHSGSLCRRWCTPQAIDELVSLVEERASALRPDSGLSKWFKEHRAIIQKEAGSWQSVQDWFSALKGRGLL